MSPDVQVLLMIGPPFLCILLGTLLRAPYLGMSAGLLYCAGGIVRVLVLKRQAHEARNAPWRWEVRSLGYRGALRVYRSGYGWTRNQAADRAFRAGRILAWGDEVDPSLGIVWRTFPHDGSWETEDQMDQGEREKKEPST